MAHWIANRRGQTSDIPSVRPSIESNALATCASLAEMQEIRQVFVVHDDGVNPAFQIWRQFFSEKWRMPRPTYVAPFEPACGDVAQPLCGQRDSCLAAKSKAEA